mmetsp:Transcript_47929/g.133177  ORF Transcript_47929/g.133177 Transcript_47929/m.133177 type:complete len:222 (-) Transcript_47929:273-938(-)
MGEVTSRKIPASWRCYRALNKGAQRRLLVQCAWKCVHHVLRRHLDPTAGLRKVFQRLDIIIVDIFPDTPQEPEIRWNTDGTRRRVRRLAAGEQRCQGLRLPPSRRPDHPGLGRGCSEPGAQRHLGCGPDSRESEPRGGPAPADQNQEHRDLHVVKESLNAISKYHSLAAAAARVALELPSARKRWNEAVRSPEVLRTEATGLKEEARNQSRTRSLPEAVGY